MPWNWWWKQHASQDIAPAAAPHGAGASRPPPFGTPPGSFPVYVPAPGIAPWAASIPDAGAVGLPLGTMPPDGCPATAEERAAQDYVSAGALGPPPTGTFCQAPPGPYFGPPLGSLDASGLPLGTMPLDGCPETAPERAAQDFVRGQQAGWAPAPGERRSAEYDYSARGPDLGPQKVDMESPPTSFGFDNDTGPTACSEDPRMSLNEPMKVTVKNTFVEVAEPGPPPGLHEGPPTMSFPTRNGKIDKTSFASDLEREKHLIHNKGECQPCAYYHQKQDKCRKGYECDFCHFCEKGELKKRKRQKAKELKAGSRPAENAAGSAEQAGVG